MHAFADRWTSSRSWSSNKGLRPIKVKRANSCPFLFMDNIVIETPRLRIIALRGDEFGQLLESTALMEMALGLEPSGAEMDSETHGAMLGLYADMLAHPSAWPWNTNWQIILKEGNVAVGSACFMGSPDLAGEVEVGYGINEDRRGCGYMTEALAGLCRWAFARGGAAAVTARTEITNPASGRVLAKCGMEVCRKEEERLWWRLRRE